MNIVYYEQNVTKTQPHTNIWSWNGINSGAHSSICRRAVWTLSCHMHDALPSNGNRKYTRATKLVLHCLLLPTANARTIDGGGWSNANPCSVHCLWWTISAMNQIADVIVGLTELWALCCFFCRIGTTQSVQFRFRYSVAFVFFVHKQITHRSISPRFDSSWVIVEQLLCFGLQWKKTESSKWFCPNEH